MWPSVPFAKESPFLEPMKKTFFEMAKSGILKKIWDKYTFSPPDVQCEEKKVSIQNIIWTLLINGHVSTNSFFLRIHWVTINSYFQSSYYSVDSF